MGADERLQHERRLDNRHDHPTPADRRPRRRQGRAHALGAARRCCTPSPAARCWRTRSPRPARRARRGSPWWWRPAWRRCAPRRSGSRRASRCSSRRRRPAPAMRVLAARPALERHQGDVIVLFADTPLVEAATLRRLVAALDAGAGIAALGFEAPDATGYGRLLLDAQGRVHRDPRAQRRQRSRAPHRPVQRRRHGLPRARPGRPARRASATATPRASTI